jgi:hypothetical protein
MGFGSSRSRIAGTPPASRVVLAVGRRVFINRPGTTGPVSLTDEHGIPAATVLSDGDEVEIVAWRPRGASGTRYRVRSRPSGADGWLGAEELRATASRPIPEPSAPASAPTGWSDAGRPFGSRA